MDVLCLEALLRCLRQDVRHGLGLSKHPRTLLGQTQILRFHWAASDLMADVVEGVVHNPRGLSARLDYVEAETQGEIVGSVSAAASAILQQRTQNPCLFIVNQPISTEVSPLNHLLQWCISQAHQTLVDVRHQHSSAHIELAWLNERIALMETALRNTSLQDIATSSMGRQRPGAESIRSAAKTRRPLYKLTLRAFRLLQSLERHEEQSVRDLLSTSVIAKLAEWQKVELAAALGITNALGEAIGVAPSLAFPIVPSAPLATVGPFRIFWQYSTKVRHEDQLDQSELMARRLVEHAGLSTAAGRADIAVQHETGAVMALVECKHFQSLSSLTNAVQEAASQIVSYARDQHSEDFAAAEGLLSRSIIFLTSRSTLNASVHRPAPVSFLSLDDLDSAALLQWAHRVTGHAAQAGDAGA